MDINDYKKYEPIDGKWYITKELGSGSFGTVLEIQRKDFPEMKSALKIISIPNSQSEVRSYKEENYDLDDKSITSYFYGFVEEFVKEFKLMSQLKGNSNIVSYEDHDIKKHDNGVGWDILIRMELLTPLGKYLADHASDKNTVVKLGIDMCKALEVCQKYNIIHRDIKPSNIFVSDNGDFKLGDFGVARTLEKTSSDLSKKGTYTYMAPEIFKGEAYGANVDTYSLGIVMYKLLNDNLEPFRTNRTFGDGEKAMELRMRGAKMVKPKNADDALAAVVLKACSYDPAERYQSPSEMRKQLEAILSAKGDEQSAGANKEEMVHEPPVIGNGAEILDNASRTSAEESGNANETVSVFLGTESEETMDEEHHTVSIFMDQKEDGSAVLNTEQEVVKAAFAHEPKDFKSSKGKAEVAKAMEKIVPLYSEKIPLSAMLGSLNMDDLKAKAQSADTDSLLVMVKSMAFHMGEGDDKNVIGPVQKCLIEELQKRPLGRSEKHTASRKQQKGKRADDTAKKTPALSERIKGFLFKTWKIIVPAIALVLLVVVGVSIYGKLGLSGADGTKVELYLASSNSDTDLKNIEKSIKARLGVLKDKASIQIEDQKMVLSLDDETLTQDPAIRKQILNWIKTKGDISIYSNINYTKSGFGKETFEDIKIITLPKENLTQYEKYFSESDYNDFMNSDTDTFYAISVRLNDSAKVYYDQMLSAVDDKLKSYGSYRSTRAALQLQMDKKEYEGATNVGTVLPDADSGNHTFLIMSPAAYSSKLADLMQYVLNEKSELPVGLEEKVVSAPKWEEDTAEFGSNQVAALDGKNVVMQFTPDDYNVDSYTQSDVKGYVSLVKKRLDTLKSPYMVGYTGIDYKTVLVKIPPSGLIANSCKMLMQEKNIAVYTQYKKLDAAVKTLTIDGTDKIVVQMDGDKNKIAEEYNKSSLTLTDEKVQEIDAYFSESDHKTAEENNEEDAPRQESGILYLLVNDVTIAQADLSAMTEDGTIEFSKFLCFEHGYCTAETSYMFDLIQEINEEIRTGESNVLRGSIDVLYYDGEKEIEDEKIDWLFDSLNDYDRQTIRTIEKLGYKVRKSLAARNCLVIKIDAEVNDDMPEKFMDAVKKIYTECNFDDGSYSLIYFQFANERAKHPDDRCRVVANKLSMSDLAVSLSVIVDGPNFEKYTPDFKKIAEQDEFFSSRLETVSQ